MNDCHTIHHHTIPAVWAGEGGDIDNDLLDVWYITVSEEVENNEANLG